jgi:hypothetical protein
VIVVNACSFDDKITVSELPVIEAYLYAHEPVDDIHIYSSVPITGDTVIYPAITDASVSLSRGEDVYLLESSIEPGYYVYPGVDLDVSEGETWSLKIVWNGLEFYAATVVPPKPVGVKMNYDTVEIPPIVPGVIKELAKIQLNITWENPEDQLYFAVIENIEPLDQLEYIIPEQFQPVRKAFLIIAEPTRASLQNFNVSSLIYLGTHIAKVYRVNQEYADLYSSRSQDSRDLNEPPSNIVGALGIFSAFSGDSVVFEVKRK